MNDLYPDEQQKINTLFDLLYQFGDSFDTIDWNLFINYSKEVQDFIVRFSNNSDLFITAYEKARSCSDVARCILQFTLIQSIKRPEYSLDYIEYIQHCSILTWNTKFFLYLQIVSFLFTASKAKNRDVNIALRQLYNSIFSEYKEYINVSVDYYNSTERNNSMVFVITNQFLNLTHGPTKTVLDRCHCLAACLHKDVIIINTAELNSIAGIIPVVNPASFGYNNELCKKDTIEYNGFCFPFIQLSNNNPTYDDTLSILSLVDQYKPSFILNIGGNSMITDLCSRIVPTLTLSTVPSGLTTTNGTFQIIGHTLTTSETSFLNLFDQSPEQVIEGLFTSSFKAQTSKLSRKELHLPEDSFILLIVGARLTDEITDEFIKTLLPVLEIGAHIAFAGRIDNYDDYCERYPELASHSTNLKFQLDMLAVAECCDLYVNPYRLGGGTSVAEAMYKGLPCVTIKHGDVALGAGNDFCVKDYPEMQTAIKRYIEDKDFYNTMSAKAISRANELTDTEKSFTNIISEYYKRIELLERR